MTNHCTPCNGLGLFHTAVTTPGSLLKTFISFSRWCVCSRDMSSCSRLLRRKKINLFESKQNVEEKKSSRLCKSNSLFKSRGLPRDLLQSTTKERSVGVRMEALQSLYLNGLFCHCYTVKSMLTSQTNGFVMRREEIAPRRVESRTVYINWPRF